jgi:HSP20 family molecular chaperone IbpA
MTTPHFSPVVVEPHQKHVLGQSDLETALHTLLDHLREPILAMKGSATEFSHSFNRSFHLGAHKPKNVNGGYARIFAPRIDMRESSRAYYIDIELPGFHDASTFTIVWRSNRELVVEGVLERPAVNDFLGLDASAAPEKKDATNGFTPASNPTTSAPPYAVADEANGFEKNEDFAPQSMWHASADAADAADVQRRLREQANPYSPPTERPSNGAGLDNSQNEDLYPLDIVEGHQLDEGDAHRVQVPTHHLPNGDYVDASQACVSIGERAVGKFMRCFVFPHVVDVQGMKSELRHGLLRIGIPKVDCSMVE